MILVLHNLEAHFPLMQSPNFIYLVTYLQVSQRVYCVDIIKSFNVKSSLKSCITKSPLLSFFCKPEPQ